MDFMAMSMIPNSTLEEASFATQVTLSQPLFLGGRLINGIRVLDRIKSLQENRYDLVLQNTIITVIHAYYDLYLAQEGLSIQRQALRNAELHAERVENLFSQGLVSEFDKLRAELEVSRLYPEVLNFENLKNLAQENFKRLTGFTGNVFLSPNLEEKTAAFAGFEVSLHDALQSATDKRIELYLANLSVDIYQVQLSAERVNFLPNVLLQADITRYNNSNSFDINWGGDNFGTMGSVGIVFQMPLFTGMSNTNKALRSRHELRKAQYEAINATELINLEVRNTWQSFNQSLRHLEVQERNIGLAQRALAIAQARFENQTGIQLEVFDAQVQYNAAQIAVSQAKIRIIKDFYALNKAMGNDLTLLIGEV
jgi:outer membrane protein TolC